jgi:hypothetical protein
MDKVELERGLKFGHTVAVNVDQHSTAILGRHAELTDANGKTQTFFLDKAGRIVRGVGTMIPKHFSSKAGKGSAQLPSELGTWINAIVEAGATQMTLRSGKGATSKAIIWTRMD